MKWLNIAGLVFQFLAFWFAAPELLGTDALKRFESGLIRFLSLFPSLLLGLTGLVLGIFMGAFGLYSGLSATKNNSDATLVNMVIIIGISVLYMVYMLFFYKKLQAWIETIFARPVILKLITNNESRKSALIIGAVLFTLGFLFQLAAALMN